MASCNSHFSCPHGLLELEGHLNLWLLELFCLSLPLGNWDVYREVTVMVVPRMRSVVAWVFLSLPHPHGGDAPLAQPSMVLALELSAFSTGRPEAGYHALHPGHPPQLYR